MPTDADPWEAAIRELAADNPPLYARLEHHAARLDCTVRQLLLRLVAEGLPPDAMRHRDRARRGGCHPEIEFR
jgi:hypothetical protein